jgi:hypothetical protein
VSARILERRRNKRLGRLLNALALSDPPEQLIVRQKLIEFLTSERRMRGLDLKEGTTDIECPNYFIGFLASDREIVSLMRDHGGRSGLNWTEDLTNSGGWPLFRLAYDVSITKMFVPEILSANEICIHEGQASLPLQLVFQNYSQKKEQRVGDLQKFHDLVGYLIEKGAEVNRNVRGNPSVIMTIADVDCPELYEMLPEGCIDREKEYYLSGTTAPIDCYQHLISARAKVLPENFPTHEHWLRPSSYGELEEYQDAT